MKPFTKISVTALGLVLLVALTPGTATAGGSIHLDLPGITLGVHDRHKNKYRHKRHKRHYQKRHHDDYYYDDYRSRRDNRRRNRDRYYNNYNNGYGDNYYYSGRRDNRYYDYSNPRRAQVCPSPGYSRYYLRDSECSSHKDHFHCKIY